jgi:sugar (pentulose or hexulose) kinase
MTTKQRPLSIGLDLGTGGARAVAVDFDGQIVAEGHAALPSSAGRVEGLCVEQDPHAWTTAAQQALRALTAALPHPCHIVGIAVDATSGSFLLIDRDDQPITPGVMYNDQRAVDVADEVAESLEAVLAPYGIRIAPTFALPKIVHLARQQPDRFARCCRIVHQTDWIVGMLSGRYDVTDVSTALKTGADPGRLAWPSAIELLGIPPSLMPEIVLPGTLVGEVTVTAGAATGLPVGTPVIAGCTDGTAGFLASGASATGDLNVTLGTTLVLKAIAAEPLIDPEGALYNHRHPGGGYLPGAASSTGCEWIERHHAGADLETLSRAAHERLPSGQIVYPLVKTGERFPFSCSQATGFGLAEIEDPAERFAAGMEAVAFLERMGIERMEHLGLPIGPTVYATGGGAANAIWLRVRASATGRTYSVPQQPVCAVGAAVLAVLPQFGGCQAAVEAIVRGGHRVDPDPTWSCVYEGLFGQFQAALLQRGYL